MVQNAAEKGPWWCSDHPHLCLGSFRVWNPPTLASQDPVQIRVASDESQVPLLRLYLQLWSRHPPHGGISNIYHYSLPPLRRIWSSAKVWVSLELPSVAGTGERCGTIRSNLCGFTLPSAQHNAGVQTFKQGEADCPKIRTYG